MLDIEFGKASKDFQLVNVRQVEVVEQVMEGI